MTEVSAKRRRLLPSAALALAAVAAYADSFRGPFVFDDAPSTADNPTIRHWATALFPPGGGVTVQGRPLLNLSFALNWHLSKGAVWSYHALNLCIHIAAVWTLFGLARRTLARAGAWAGGARPTSLAFVIALLWAVHPLLTESVTYVAQRAESLMGLFYLLTLYGFARGTFATDGPADDGAPTRGPRTNEGRTGRRAWPWFALSWLACLLGMGTKEVMVSAPAIVFLYDRTFVSGTFREAWNRRRLHLAFAATWIPLALLALRTGTRGGTSGFGSQARPLAYYATQPRAIVHYLAQCFWPRPLVFDYGTQWVHSAGEVVPYALVLAALAALTVAGLRRWPAAGFLGTFFFAILSVTSLVPGARQTSAEQRMYLPLAAVLAFVVCGACRLAAGRSLRLVRRLTPACVGCLAIALAAATFLRNRDYRSAEALYGDNVRKMPDNAFAHYDLATSLAHDGRLAEAIPQYRETIRLNPGMINAYLDLAKACRPLGRLAEAETACQGALGLNPNYAPARYTLGLVYLDSGRKADAEEQFNDTLLLDPSNAEAEARLRELNGAAR